MAAQKGVPFIPMRGLIGSDILRTRPDWTVIDNPFEKDDPIVAIPAIRPDVCLFHAPEADVSAMCGSAAAASCSCSPMPRP